MKTKQMGILATAFSALLISMGAFASDVGMSAAGPGPGGGEGGVPVYPTNPGTGGGGCYFAYHIRKVGPRRAEAGDEIKYRIFLSNVGNCDLRRIRVTDFLPEGTEFISAEPRPTFVRDEKIVWEDIRLEEREREVFEIRARVEKDWDKDSEKHRRRRIVNTGCAFTPWIGIRICDSAETWVENDDRHSHPQQ